MQKLWKFVVPFVAVSCWMASVGIAHADDTSLSPQQEITQLGGQTLITLHLKNATPQEFYTALWSQTSLPPFDAKKFQFWRKPPSITLDVDNEPFWLVIRQVAVKYGISVATSGNSPGEYHLAPQQYEGNVVGAMDSEGPLLFTISSIESSMKRTIKINSHPQQPVVKDWLGLGINIFSDPKFPMVSMGDDYNSDRGNK